MGATQGAVDVAGHWSDVNDYHNGLSLFTNDTLYAHYKALVNGQPGAPDSGLNDMMTYAWRNALAP